MKIVISSGHGLYIRGASGSPVPPQCDEVDEARKVVEMTASHLRAAGIDVKTYHDDVSTSQNENLNRIVDYHNSQTRDLDVSVHFNAFDHSAHGCEVLYVTQESLAKRVCDAMCDAGEFTNRGAKYRNDLFFLGNTEEPAILLETCFCDNTSDCNLYRENFDAICAAIAETIGGVDLPEQPPEQPPEMSGNRIEVTSEIEGDVSVFVNDVLVHGRERNRDVAHLTIAKRGDVTLVINGEEFHNWPEQPTHPPPLSQYAPNHSNIFATTFGGAVDNEHSAYPPYDSQGQGEYLDDDDLYISLPANITDADVRDRGVEVYYRATNKKAIGKIRDKGPWVINDDPYIAGDTRPVAEQCYNDDKPLPVGSGNNAGLIPGNPAGIDLSPGMFRALGMDDNDVVDWRFVEAKVA